jgi:CII-binding regulator of phage lambda lysogenization HflD
MVMLCGACTRISVPRYDHVSNAADLASLALLQARLTAELEALHRSLEQRERAVKELHTRIHQLEEVEVALNHTNATLALKVGWFA